MLLERLGIAPFRFTAAKGDKTASVMRRKEELSAWLEQGWSYRRCAKEFGVHPWIVKNVCNQLGLKAREFDPNKWDKRKDELLAMLRQGMKRSEIARKLGVTRNAIVGACYRLNLGADEIVQAKTKEAIREQMRALSARGVAKRKANGSKPRKQKAPIAVKRDPWHFYSRPKVISSPVSPPDGSARCDIMGLAIGRCRYPADDECKFYCGATTETDTGSWCPYHAQFVFQRMSGDARGTTQRHPRLGVESNSPPLRSVNSTPLIHEAA